jgi:O-methyltransferase involved in polyketide biosynthesis
MNEVNKTLYIPLHGKALVSQKGLILKDEKAEYIWEREGFPLKGKSKSKWLAYYMAMRARVFDDWLKKQMDEDPKAVILHIGCGMDSRIDRIGESGHLWYDIDFPEVIQARKNYYTETETYKMIEGDLRESEWLQAIPKGGSAIVVLEGVSMYLPLIELQKALTSIQKHFSSVKILMDCYTEFAAKMSKYRNPVNEVGVTTVYGLDDPKQLEAETGCNFVKEHVMTPMELIDELQGMERFIFKKLYAGKMASKLYKLYEFEITKTV